MRRVVAVGQRDAVAANESRQQVAGLAGPALGGVLFGAGRALPFAVDAVSHLVSFCAVWTLRTPLRGTSGRGGGVWHGVRWLWRRPFLRTATLWLSCAGALFAAVGLITLVLAQERGATAAGTGLLFTVAGVGGLAGAFAAPWLVRRCPPRVLLAGYGWLATAATCLLLVDGPLWLFALAGAVAFFPVPRSTRSCCPRWPPRCPTRCTGASSAPRRS